MNQHNYKRVELRDNLFSCTELSLWKPDLCTDIGFILTFKSMCVGQERYATRLPSPHVLNDHMLLPIISSSLSAFICTLMLSWSFPAYLWKSACCFVSWVFQDCKDVQALLEKFLLSGCSGGTDKIDQQLKPLRGLPVKTERHFQESSPCSEWQECLSLEWACRAQWQCSVSCPTDLV